MGICWNAIANAIYQLRDRQSKIFPLAGLSLFIFFGFLPGNFDKNFSRRRK
jgi:hypothetical protein